MRRDRSNNNWMSFTDLMTGLMVVFMFVAVSFILEIVSDKFAQDKIYNTLNAELANDLNDWGAELSEDLTVRFTPQDESNFFENSSYRIDDSFEKTLDEFFPKYLKIITDTSYLDYISEIRIEGHTNSQPNKSIQFKKDLDNYEYNLELSSRRAQEVLKYVKRKFINQLPDKEVRERLEFLLTANGLSYTKRLSTEGGLFYTTKNGEEDFRKSKRVDFKIMTTNKNLVDKLLENYE